MNRRTGGNVESRCATALIRPPDLSVRTTDKHSGVQSAKQRMRILHGKRRREPPEGPDLAPRATGTLRAELPSTCKRVKIEMLIRKWARR
eukprot:1489376-Pyramimonas_sp.AAC.1